MINFSLLIIFLHFQGEEESRRKIPPTNGAYALVYCRWGGSNGGKQYGTVKGSEYVLSTWMYRGKDDYWYTGPWWICGL